jgi:[NiFe] hydrogenase diaphorase moiety large subunit
MIDSTIFKPLTFNEIEPNAGLRKALSLSPAAIIQEITDSGLKGRGGAGFPTGMKWGYCARAAGVQKYVICNADEGEPGTFKDRVILTEYPDLVFEGMTIAARAIGASKGLVYLRGEYTYLLGGLQAALARRRADKLLGSAILGDKGFDFDIEIRLGSGAYVCGEETALIESLEGHRGESRNRPPFPADTGLDGQPSIVNNVETFAWAACIMTRTADWFRVVGTDKSRGFKLFSVSGDIDQPGVYELPLGITVAELLREVGGENAKAAVIGGAAGRCVGRQEFDRLICYEDVPTGGSVIVFGPGRDMLGIAENFLEFMCEESCGQCTPCRIGNPKLLECVRMLKAGTCSASYLRQIVSLAESIHLASKCGLGQSSGNVFLSIVEHFKDEIMGRTVEAV